MGSPLCCYHLSFSLLALCLAPAFCLLLIRHYPIIDVISCLLSVLSSVQRLKHSSEGLSLCDLYCLNSTHMYRLIGVLLLPESFKTRINDGWRFGPFVVWLYWLYVRRIQKSTAIIFAMTGEQLDL